jgi:outer membrane protein TolC
MTRYKTITGVIFYLLLSAGISLAAEETPLQLDFSSAILQMNNTNALLQSARYEKEKSEYEKKSAVGLFFPKIDINFTYMHLNAPIEMDFNPLRDAMIGLSAESYAKSVVTANPAYASSYNALKQGFITNADANPALARSNFIETVQEQDFWTVSATIKQPVFTGGKIIAANKAASANCKIASEKVRYTQNALQTELAQRYYALRLSMKVVDVRKEVLDGMATHLNQAKKMQESGMIPNAERLHAEVAYSEAEREYKKSLRDKDTVLSALKNTLSTNSDIIPVSELFMSDNIQDIRYYKDKSCSA